MAFKYVSAGVTPDDLAYHIFIKYETNNVKAILPEYDKERKLLIARCPDRTVYISEKNDFRPDSFDEYLSPNIYEYGSVPSKYTDSILFSAHNWKKAKKLDRSEWCSNPDLKVMIDSGGAQLRFGTSLFVNPKKVIEVYDKAADIALALDVPPRPADALDPRNLELLARVQKMNGEVFKKLHSKTSKARFMNVLHGFSVEDHKRWMDIVDDPFFDAGWAIGFDRYSPPLNIIQTFALLERSPIAKNGIHFLGVSGKTLFPYLAWFGKYIPNLTCDSSQHVHTAIRARIIEYFTPDGNITQYKFGSQDLMGKKDKKGGEKIKLAVIKPNPFAEIPSNNPIIHALKYAAFFGFDTNTGVSNILSAHNLINNNRVSRWWVDVAENSTLPEYKKWLFKLIRDQKLAAGVAYQCDIIEYCQTHGWKQAMKRYANELKEDNGIHYKHMPTLFGDKKEKRASLENLNHRDSAVVEVLPNYLSYSELKDFMTKERYEEIRLMHLMKGKKVKGEDMTMEQARERFPAKKIFHNGWSLEEEHAKEKRAAVNREKKANRKKRGPRKLKDGAIIPVKMEAQQSNEVRI